MGHIDLEFLQNIPKCELHVHIEGTLEPELRFKLAKRNKIPMKFGSVEDVIESYRDMHDLPSFLANYYAGMEVLRTAEDFYDLTMAYLTRVAKQNMYYVEIFFDPQAHTSRGVPFDVVIKGIRRAQIDAKKTLGIESARIMCFLRDFQAEFAMATLLESLPYRDWIIGVGLDSNEHNNPPEKFAEVFKRARQEGYMLTAHCDVDQENSIEHIRQCLHDIKVDRIDHGTNILESSELTQELIERKIGLTSCPISNSWVSSSTKYKEVRKLLDLGAKITINSDDPAYFKGDKRVDHLGYLLENLIIITEEAQLSHEDLIQLQHNAIDISWAPEHIKRAFKAELNQFIS